MIHAKQIFQASQNSLLVIIEKFIVGAHFMALSKALDTVDHSLLLAKLNAYGFDNISLRFFESY